MKNQGIIFDLDGTLVDSLPGITEALNAALASEGLPGHPASAVRGFVGDGLDATVSRACPPGGNDDAQVARLVEMFRKFYQDCWHSGTRPYPGLRDLLAELGARGAPLGVLSNKSDAFTGEMVSRIFPDVPFTAVLGLRPEMTPKPDPSGAFELAEALTLRPSQCLIVGDSTMDIATAKRAGMRSCAVTWGYHDAPLLAAAGPEILVADVDELRQALQGSGQPATD